MTILRILVNVIKDPTLPFLMCWLVVRKPLPNLVHLHIIGCEMLGNGNSYPMGIVGTCSSDAHWGNCDSFCGMSDVLPDRQ